MAAYAPLLSEPAFAADVQANGWGSPGSRRSGKLLRRVSHRIFEETDRTVWFVLFACLVSVTTLCVHLGIFYYPAPPSTPSPEKLTYPNPYIGLEKAVLVDPAPAAPIVNFPLLLAQINSSDPTAAYVQQPHWNSYFGMIYPEDREFLINTEVSTIAQFRTLDFGMERCVATLEIPSQDQIQDKPSKSISTSAVPFTMEIWVLDAEERIDPHSLTWATRPTRIDLLTTMVFHRGYNLLHSSPFLCQARTFLAFEIRCSACHLHFRQDKKSPRLAFFITQHPSSLDVED
ncbi:hypothetical protein MVEN_01615900 [Mycena venus]|uniref:Ubiquitin 3 binding protein But2 C-terminal domain-containing protein n=1 Tax=Mycena venus TaxID=2733690 RepID=A0A8H6XT53_9AGAR|nr:hypothetical protein MVEN_01615900 [Mycena venus]